MKYYVERNLFMQRTKDTVFSKEYLPLLILVLFTFLSLALPSKIALVLTAAVFAVYAFLKPFDSILYLAVYVAIRPFLTEINPGLKLIGDIITVVLLVKLIIASKFDLKGLLKFKFFEWAFFVFLLLGSIVGYINGVSLGAIIFQIRTFIIMYLIYYFLSRTKLPENWPVKLAWTGVGLGWLLSLHGLVEKLSIRQLLLPTTWKYMPLSEENFARIYSLPGNPNSLALILMFCIIGIFYLKHVYDTANTEQYKIFLNISYVLFFGIFFLTYSRGTLISATILAIVYIIMTKNYRLIKQLVLGAIAGLILVFYPVNSGVMLVKNLGVEAPDASVVDLSERFGQLFQEKNVNRMQSTGRIFYIKKGFEIFSDYPITGSGFGTFGGAATISYGSPIYEKYGIDLSIYYKNKIYSDNQYIQIIAETGILGVIAFSLYLLGMLALFWKRRDTKFGAFMAALWLSTCASGAYYNIWELKIYTLIFFIILALFALENKFYKQYELR